MWCHVEKCSNSLNRQEILLEWPTGTVSVDAVATAENCPPGSVPFGGGSQGPIWHGGVPAGVQSGLDQGIAATLCHRSLPGTATLKRAEGCFRPVECSRWGGRNSSTKMYRWRNYCGVDTVPYATTTLETWLSCPCTPLIRLRSSVQRPGRAANRTSSTRRLPTGAIITEVAVLTIHRRRRPRPVATVRRPRRLLSESPSSALSSSPSSIRQVLASFRTSVRHGLYYLLGRTA